MFLYFCTFMLLCFEVGFGCNHSGWLRILDLPVSASQVLKFRVYRYVSVSLCLLGVFFLFLIYLIGEAEGLVHG